MTICGKTEREERLRELGWRLFEGGEWGAAEEKVGGANCD